MYKRQTLNFLRLFEELQMRGGALRVNGEIVAFTVGEAVGMRQDTLVAVSYTHLDVYKRQYQYKLRLHPH